LIELTGFDEKSAVQTERTLLLMRVFEIGLPIVLSVFSIFFVRAYPITEARAYEVKERLAARRAEGKSV
jgi:glycoside/pentoside/hexuronide:cation symporter, GPH family